jgi:hypothetical protein
MWQHPFLFTASFESSSTSAPFAPFFLTFIAGVSIVLDFSKLELKLPKAPHAQSPRSRIRIMFRAVF